MALKKEDVLRILYPRAGAVRGRRFTQDTAILPDVWTAFAIAPEDQHKGLLLTPHAESDTAMLLQAVRRRLAQERGLEPQEILLPYNESHVLAEVTYRELLRAILPLSSWWRKHVTAPGLRLGEEFRDRLLERSDLPALLFEPGIQDAGSSFTEDVLDLVRIGGAVGLRDHEVPDFQNAPSLELRDYGIALVHAFAGLMEGLPPHEDTPQPPLWSVFLNREAEGAVSLSRLSVKADAAVRLFGISCRGLIWAVIDSGIDARHPAFKKRLAESSAPPGADCAPARQSRVLRTYDFRRLKSLMQWKFESPAIGPSVFDSLDEDQQSEIRRDLRRRLLVGRPLDWKLLEPLLQIPHDEHYLPPRNGHGTHVAGILAGDWPPEDGEADRPALVGMCPDLELYDLRVFDDEGRGDEFVILSALQFVRHLNQSKDRMVVQGVNLSFSLRHAVESFACGSTPICEECERLVGAGVVAIAAAGNQGYRQAETGTFVDYRNISITDPGNADCVITVGATHRHMPHKYGVSYFSSRGPTGDGRLKPDLVAPGEKIESLAPDGSRATLDGTSMAAPHVSGAAALLMARHPEMIGRPARVKDILCRTATDLGRERTFQGAGMLDVLRALQSV